MTPSGVGQLHMLVASSTEKKIESLRKQVSHLISCVCALDFDSFMPHFTN